MTRSSVCVRPQLDYDMNMRKVATHLCRDTQDSLVRKAKDIAWQASKAHKQIGVLHSFQQSNQARCKVLQ